jgi:hypothetical protein
MLRISMDCRVKPGNDGDKTDRYSSSFGGGMRISWKRCACIT